MSIFIRIQQSSRKNSCAKCFLSIFSRISPSQTVRLGKSPCFSLFHMVFSSHSWRYNVALILVFSFSLPASLIHLLFKAFQSLILYHMTMTVPSSFLALVALSFSFVTVTTAAPLATAGDFNTLTTNETTSEALLLIYATLN